MEDENWRKHRGKTFGQTLALVRFFGVVSFFPRLSGATHFHSSSTESGACGRSTVWLLDSAYLIKVEQDLSAVQLVSLQANSLVHQQLLGNTQGEKKKTLGKQKNRRANLCRRIASWLV